MSTTFGMIKPEGLKYADNIEARIRNTGLKVEKKRKLILSVWQFENIYSHAKHNIPDVYESMKYYMTSNPVVILKVTGKSAVEKLLELRGCSNAAEARHGTIRKDYAGDQDYKTLYSKGEFAKNVFHASDSKEAQDMLDIFFRGKK